MRLSAILVCLALSACGGGGDDEGVPSARDPLREDEIAALEAQCVGHGRLVKSARAHLTMPSQGVTYHWYASGECADGTLVRLVATYPGG